MGFLDKIKGFFKKEDKDCGCSDEKCSSTETTKKEK